MKYDEGIFECCDLLLLGWTECVCVCVCVCVRARLNMFAKEYVLKI